MARGWAGVESPWDFDDEENIVTSNVNLEGYFPKTAIFAFIDFFFVFARERLRFGQKLS